MSRASSHALRHPPVTAPSDNPAGAGSPLPRPSLAGASGPELLEKELAAPDYEARMIAIGTNTDPYQPIERERKIMRGILEVLERAGHPVGIVTKSALVTRDIDILARMAKRNLVKVALSVTTLDAKLARTIHPPAS